MIYPVILRGGTGSRLWSLSRALLPKQFLPLVSDRTMLQEIAARLAGLEGVTAPLSVSNAEHPFPVAEQLRDVGVKPHTHILEPVGRNTAPAARFSWRACAEKTLVVCRQALAFHGKT